MIHGSSTNGRDRVMTPRERVEAVLTGQTPDRVPVHHIGICCRVASKLLGREAWVGGGINQWRESLWHWNGVLVYRFLRSVRSSITQSLGIGYRDL